MLMLALVGCQTPARLPLFNIGNFAFINLQDDTVTFQRGDFKQGLATFYW